MAQISTSFVLLKHISTQSFFNNILVDEYDTDFRKDRNSHGGGVLIYVPSTIKATRRIDIEPTLIECIGLEIYKPTCNFFLCCVYVYRHPNSDKPFWDKFLWSVDKASDISSKFLIAGDLNVDFF